MTKLWINDILMDLGDARITETRQINTFLELKDRQTSFTNKFTLPETHRNVYYLEMFGAVGSNSDIPYKLNTASVYRRGVPTIENETAIIQKRTYGKGYPVSIQFGNNSLFDDISNSKLSDLDFDLVNHNFNADTIISSFTNTYLEGYMYTVADYGFVNGSVDELPILGSFQVPSLFIKYVWDLIFSEYGYTYTYVGDNNVFETDVFENTMITTEVPIKTLVGDDVVFNDRFNSLKQKDFIKTIIQDYGLMFQRKQGSTNYEFITIDDFVYRNDKCVDFSQKFNRRISIDSSLKGYGKENFMRYQYDNEDDSFFDGSFDIDNDTLKDTQDLFTSPFKAPNTSQVEINGTLLFSMPFFEPVFNEDGSTKEVKENTSKPYLHTFERYGGNVSYFYNTLQTRTSTVNTPFMSFQGLSYGQKITDYYSQFVLTLQRSNLLVVELNLTAIDVLSFDFFNLVYIKQLGGTFYMNKISGFEPGKTTKCELIPISSALSAGEYSDAFSDAFNN